MNNVKSKPRSYFLAALDIFTGGKAEPKYGWWVGASDEKEEGQWVWQQSGDNVTESLWYFFGRGLPGVRFNEFGDDDCAMLVDASNFLR